MFFIKIYLVASLSHFLSDSAMSLPPLFLLHHLSPSATPSPLSLSLSNNLIAPFSHHPLPLLATLSLSLSLSLSTTNKSTNHRPTIITVIGATIIAIWATITATTILPIYRAQTQTPNHPNRSKDSGGSEVKATRRNS
ncbi:unnamed protein product [Ilex paraguariensis]|uniref:Uncharacterized protein n=1 Tax=Ilex paraguariensis TaxID=185542 RepID=A0ABC8UPF9_9AQUA